MITVEDALELALALAKPVEPEDVALREALGRVLVAPAAAKLNQPPFASSAMDGYAICAADHHPGQTLTVIGESAAGCGFASAVAQGQAVRIFTGAPVPKGGEIVVIQENTTRDADRVTLSARLDTHDNIRPLGSDFSLGDTLSGPRRLGPNDLALLAAMNVDRVTVARRPVVAIIATGDELVMPGETPGPDQILCSNTFALAALAEKAGAKVNMLPIARDTEDSLRTIFGQAEGADLIVTVGGASVGDHDLVGKVAADLGLARSFYKIAMRPGKPLMAGKMGEAAMLGLPGNPVSAIVCAHLFMLPLLAQMQGLKGRHDTRKAVLGADVGPTGPRAHYMRARLSNQDALPHITPFDAQDSALLRLLSEADALLIRPLGDGPRKAGETVDYLPI
ncbi:gephyrin-like molybdotransferase Glp [Phaeovulum sp.]|uniref:molybdopterin molybdotransferase MoeA n=1 Tax=Phaeovulum sp. TaxID=2934796 RepID=UPI0039E4C25E